MANPKVSGIIKLKARHGKAFTLDGHIGDDGQDIWYTAFEASQIGEVQSGAEVEFEVKINKKGDRTYHNIQKNIRVHNPGSGGGSSTGPVASGGARSTAKPGAIAIDRERCIVRQNSVNVAAQAMQSMLFSESDTTEDMVRTLLTIAKEIEDHTSGDADLKAALAAKAAPLEVVDTGDGGPEDELAYGG
jgi:hypothetical protein